MSRKKIVAYRITYGKEGIELDAMTESPRGTRVFSNKAHVDTKGKTKAEEETAIADAINSMQLDT